ncbi:hypothetical protein QF011_003542 [Curtobacterium flaccumfaciens]|nr:hypothetical protein [Curtobacterium flaccumfaciens]
MNPPMAGQWQLTPLHCLKIVALARLICPTAEIRLAGGRELHLGTLQGLALHLANSIFLGDYLTAEGQAAAADHALIRDNGFVTDTAVRPETSPEQSRSLRIRRRGAGTNVDPNASHSAPQTARNNDWSLVIARAFVSGRVPRLRSAVC